MSVGLATMENSMQVPQKLELPYNPAITFLGIYLENKNYSSKRHLHPYVQSSTIYNRQDTEAT